MQSNIRMLLLVAVVCSCSTTMRLPTVDRRLVEEEAYKQRVLAATREREFYDRLYDVSFAVVSSNASLCKKKTRLLAGYSYQVLSDVRREWRDVWRDVLGLSDSLSITYVAKNSPADISGLIPGDKIVGVNGKKSPEIRHVKRLLSEAAQEVKEGKRGHYVLNLWRDGETFSIGIKPERVCKYHVLLVRNDEVNAWADGKAVYITTGMMRFTQSDDGLALIVGHELAHITLGHIDKKQTNSMLGALAGAVVSVVSGIDVTESGAVAGALAFSQDFEAESDYVGAYYAYRAGFDLSKGVQLWREMAINHPKSIDLRGSTHPSTAKRFVAIESTIKEIDEKERHGLLIAPTRQGE